MEDNKTKLEIKIEERNYQFVCEPDSGLGEVFDVLSRMRNYILQRMVDAENQESQSQEKTEENIVVDEPEKG